MLQNSSKTLGFKKNMVYKIPPGGGGVNHIQPVASVVKDINVIYKNNETILISTLKVPKKMHLKMSSAEVFCCK